MNLKDFSYFGTPDPKDCGPFLSIRQLRELYPPEVEGWPAPTPVTPEELASILESAEKAGRRLGEIQDQIICKNIFGV